MKKLQTLTAYPISASRYNTKYGDRIRVTFTYEVQGRTETDRSFYHTEKPLRVLELVDNEENFGVFMTKKIKQVVLKGMFSDFKFQLVDFDIIK